ncbi:hypothetical protein SAMN04515674_1042 [Pseudarcicella hirudinis]|uniref:GW domain-containing protein n=1 Tax=Pseudarcicella hirudinis TaxID=1079859 RepID=A0A1I5RBT5_9BACT|nr:hypothetical protein [Pseudarcicella hirudinis]SFP55994.1 hypothetical protein SAMN04515674_1042 [Pseudarcicella hirudinis]
MKRIYLLLSITLSISTKGQIPTIRQYLQGIWKMECCDPDYWVYNKNQIYWVNKDTTQNYLKPNSLYCIPRTPIFNYNKFYNKAYKEKIPLDSVDFDRPFYLEETTKSEIFYVLYYDSTDIVHNQWLKVRDNISRLNYDYYITPKELNHFYVWDGGAPSAIVNYNRILSPPKYVLDFYKKIAFESFKKIRFQKRFILDDSFTLTKMYLIEGDEVEILEEKLVKGISWLKIRYYGSKTIEGWIKKTDVE